MEFEEIKLLHPGSGLSLFGKRPIKSKTFKDIPQCGYSFFDRLLFNNITSYVKACRRGSVHDSDLVESPINIYNVMETFEAAWAKECQTHEIGKCSLFRTLIRACWWEFTYYVISYTLREIEDQDITSTNHNMKEFVSTIVLSLLVAVQQISNVTAQHANYLCIHKTLIGLRAVLLKKAVDMSGFSTVSPSEGKQLDFIAAEVAYVAEGFTAIVYVIASLVSLLVLIIVLPSLLLGVRVAISGAAIIFAAIVLLLFIGYDQKRKHMLMVKHRGQRLDCMSEFFDKVKTLKIQTWDEMFAKDCCDIRATEVKYSTAVARRVLYIFVLTLTGAALGISIFLTSLVILGTGAGKASQYLIALNCSKRITMALDEEKPCKDWFERFNGNNGEATGSIMVEGSLLSYKRCSDAILTSLVGHPKVTTTNIRKQPFSNHEKSLAISPMTDLNQRPTSPPLGSTTLSNGVGNNISPVPKIVQNSFDQTDCLKESSAELPFILSIQPMAIKPGEHVAVIGTTIFSGTTSFVRAIIGEMICLEGHVSIHGSIAYCGQEPWIFPGTIVSNIVMNSPMEQEWYDIILDATCLRMDLESLPMGDLSLISDKGVNLSGGQKQRISFARALYSRRDIYVLDHPLSAVDRNTTKLVYDKCFNDLLADRTVIMAVRQNQLQPHFTSVVFIKDDGVRIVEETAVKISTASLGTDERVMAYRERHDNVSPNSKLGCHLDSDCKYSDDKLLNTEQQNLIRSGSCNLEANQMSNEFVCEEVVDAVEWSTFMIYIRKCGMWWILLSIFLFFMKQAAFGMGILLLGERIHVNSDLGVKTTTLAYICFCSLGFWILSATLILISSMGRGMKRIHNDLFKSMLRAPVSFFHNTPKGSITNWFTANVIKMDNMCIQGIATMLITQVVAVICYFVISIVAVNYTWIVIVPSFIIITWTLVWSIKPFVHAYLYSCRIRPHYLGILSLTTLVMYQLSSARSSYNRRAIRHRLIQFFNSHYLYGFYYKCISSFSAERIEPEAALTVPGQNPPDWPKSGSISFCGVTTRYDTCHRTVLEDFNLEIKSGENIGIIGRTASGKSTIGLLLFRILEPEVGTILIDGVDYRGLGLKDLRQAMSYVGHEPTLFSGTLRRNLDQYDQYSDTDIFRAINACHCTSFVPLDNLSLSKDFVIDGSMFSVGTRQLLCLTRAVLERKKNIFYSNPKIVFLDEITAYLDVEMGNLIKNAVEEQFKTRTVLAISHQLEFLRDFDRYITVVDKQAIELPRKRAMSDEFSPYTEGNVSQPPAF